MEKRPAVVVPREVALSAIVAQSNCPLQILSIEGLLLLDGWTGYRYEVRNQSDRPIRSYSIAVINTTGTGSMFSRRPKTPSGVLMPGESDSPDGSEDKVQVIPLTKQLRNQLKLKERLQVVMLFIVVRVEFADGSVYDDEQTKQALTTFFLDNLVEAAPQKKQSSK